MKIRGVTFVRQFTPSRRSRERDRSYMDQGLPKLRANLRIAICFAIAICGVPVSAQSLHDEQIWVNTTAIGSVKDRLVYFAEVQGRSGTAPRQFRQLLLRPAIGWRLSDRFTAYMGYARVVTDTSDTAETNEDRLFQQLNCKRCLGTAVFVMG